MKRSILLLLVVVLGIQLGTMPATAAIPANLSYQGMLTEQDGSTVADGDYEITFRLYTIHAGGTAIWSEVQTVAVLRSVFTATLGTVTPLGALAFDVPYYLGLSVAGGAELAPRQLVTPAAYSFHARSVADGSITAAKIAAGAVGTAKIQDGAVTQEKLAEGIEIPLTGTASGDLTGTYPDPTVAQIRGRNVATTEPSDGQVLKWTGSSWAPQAEEGMTLPYSGSSGGSGASFQVTNTAASGTTYGVYGVSSSTGGRGVYGDAVATTGFTYGGEFRSASGSGVGVYGLASATTGNTSGVYGRSIGSSGRGVYGYASSLTGTTYGGRFDSASSSGSGVYGWAQASTGNTYGVYGRSNSNDGGCGVYGLASATTGTTYGGHFESASSSGLGLFGRATATTGMTYGVSGVSISTSGRGALGNATATTGITYGVIGQSASTSGYGVYGLAYASTGHAKGVYGQATSSHPNAHGVYSNGNLAATGTKSFQIDHPFDPANMYLNHYCTEGAEPLNAYSGNVVMDGRGEAVAELPHYFESINRDYRYQLTPLGAAMPDLHVAERIRENRFRIAGGKPGTEVSWRVEAVRNDLYMQQRGAPVELEKPAEHRGTYLHPEFYGLPAEMGTYHHPEMPDDPRPGLRGDDHLDSHHREMPAMDLHDDRR